VVESSTIVGACVHLLGMVVIVFGAFIVNANPDSPNHTVFIIGLVIYVVGAFIRGFVNTMFILPIATGIITLILILFFGVPFWIVAYLFHISKLQDVANILSSIAFVISVFISPLFGLIFYFVELFSGHDDSGGSYGGGEGGVGSHLVVIRYYNKYGKYTGYSERRERNN